MARAGGVARRAACGGAGGGDLCVPPADRLDTAAGCRCDRLRALDRMEGAEAGRPLAASQAREGAGQELRVVGPGRSAAHGHEPLRPLPATRASGHRRPLAAITQLDAPRDEGGLRLRPRDRRRRLPPRVRRALRRREGGDRHRLRRAGARLLRRARDRRRRLITDSAFTYVHNRSLRELLAREGIRHLTTQPYRPRTNGKVERFHQAMAREWAYGLAHPSHRQRNEALPHGVNHDNRRRPHSSIGDRPPVNRVHAVGRTPSPRRAARRRPRPPGLRAGGRRGVGGRRPEGLVDS